MCQIRFFGVIITGKLKVPSWNPMALLVWPKLRISRFEEIPWNFMQHRVSEFQWHWFEFTNFNDNHFHEIPWNPRKFVGHENYIQNYLSQTVYVVYYLYLLIVIIWSSESTRQYNYTLGSWPELFVNSVWLFYLLQVQKWSTKLHKSHLLWI